VRAEHRTLCGLAPIDAPAGELLEPGLVAGWLPYLARGAAYRRGRVWLWPTTGATLQHGLARRLGELAVEVRRGWRVTALATAGAGAARRITELRCSDGGAPATIAVAAVIVNGPYWRIRASYLARETLRAYLAPDGTPRVQGRR